MNSIISKIKESNKIAISAHISPDGDAIGSTLALTLGLRDIGKDVYIVSKDKVPDNCSFLSNSNEIDGETIEISKDTDCLIALDCADLKRISANIDLNNRDFILINIDHHISNELYGDLNLVDANAAAVGEIVYKILINMNIVITDKIAECLYASIVSDTGSFKYSSTTSKTHDIAGSLIKTGIDFNKIHRMLFENKSYSKIRLYAKVLDSLTLTHSNKICVMEITEKMLSELNISDLEDTSDIISFGMQIKEVEVAVLLKEKKDEDIIKVSLRSKSKVDVCKIAKEFEGGGHPRAAGLTLNCNIDDAKEKLVNNIKKVMDNL